MSRVFLLERPRRQMDTTSAEAYGEVHYLFDDRDRRASVLNSEMYVSDVIAQLKTHGFNAMCDYFCIAGGVLNISEAMIALTLYAINQDTQLKLLVFNSSTDLYEERSVDLLTLLKQTGDKHATPPSSGSGTLG